MNHINNTKRFLNLEILCLNERLSSNQFCGEFRFIVIIVNKSMIEKFNKLFKSSMQNGKKKKQHFTKQREIMQ